MEALLRIVNGYMISQCVYVAAKLGIADMLKDGTRDCEELAAASEVHASSLYRILRTLAGFGIFAEHEERRFTLTPMAELLRSDVPGSLRSWSIMRGEEFLWQPWGQILHSVKTGESAFFQVFGMGTWEYFAQCPEASAIFDDAMRSISAQKFGAVANAYDFSDINTIVDVGGGNGGLITSILTSNPHMNGVLADLSQVAESARKHIEAAGLSDRCTCVTIDMFESVPEGADAYIMANVIHDWHDEEAIKTLQNCRRALEPGGRVLLVEMLVTGPNEPHQSKLVDIEMLIMERGKERSEGEYRTLYEAAGFRLARVIPTDSPWGVIEGVAV
jgi:cyclopropane fatty-acyl-phospholipid synthase-like methyltransferase